MCCCLLREPLNTGANGVWYPGMATTQSTG